MFEYYLIENYLGDAGNWLQTLFGGLIGALISGGIAWYVSKRNINAQGKLEKEKREHEKAALEKLKREYLNDQLEHFIELLKSVVKEKIDTQKKNREYIENVEKNPLGYHPFKLEILGDLERLLEFNSLDIKNALKIRPGANQDSKVFRQLLSGIDYYRAHTKTLHNTRNEMLSEWQKIAGEVAQMVTELRANIADVVYDIRENHQDGAKEQYGNPFNEILTEYTKGINVKNTSELNYHKEEFVDKVVQLSVHDQWIYGYFADTFRLAKTVQSKFGNFKSTGDEIAMVIGRIDTDLVNTNERITKIIQTYFDPNFNSYPKQDK